MENMKAQPAEAAVTLWHNPWPRKARIRPNADTAAFRLLDCPTEIVTRIFEGLVPAPLPTGTRLPLSREVLASRRALVNLRLTSKFCNEVALPLMYRNVIITNRKQMANLLVNLITHQSRCQWMRSVAVVADMMSEEISVQDNRAILTRSRRLLETSEIPNQSEALAKAIFEAKRCIHHLYDYIESASLDRNWHNLYTERTRLLYYRLLRIILYVGTRVEDLLVSTPYLPFNYRLEEHHAVILRDLDAMTSGQLPPSSNAQAGFGDTFKALRRVRTQPDTSKWIFQDIFPLSLEFLKSQQWEFVRDNGRWFSLTPSFQDNPLRGTNYLEIFSHVTELRLYDSRTHPAWLRRCFRHAKNLKIFCYTTRPSEWNHGRAWDALTAEELDSTLQQALDEVRDTLTDLHLGWGPSEAYLRALKGGWALPVSGLTEKDRAAVAPHRVDVSGFPRLKKVDIDPLFLFHDY